MENFARKRSPGNQGPSWLPATLEVAPGFSALRFDAVAGGGPRCYLDVPLEVNGSKVIGSVGYNTNIQTIYK